MTQGIIDINSIVAKIECCQKKNESCSCFSSFEQVRPVANYLDTLQMGSKTVAIKIVSLALSQVIDSVNKSCECLNMLISRTQMHDREYVEYFALHFPLEKLPALNKVVVCRRTIRLLWKGYLNLYKKIPLCAQPNIIDFLVKHYEANINVLKMSKNDYYNWHGYVGTFLIMVLNNPSLTEVILPKFNKDIRPSVWRWDLDSRRFMCVLEEGSIWKDIKKMNNPTLSRYVDTILEK